jgi:hypothetical protein
MVSEFNGYSLICTINLTVIFVICTIYSLLIMLTSFSGLVNRRKYLEKAVNCVTRKRNKKPRVKIHGNLLLKLLSIIKICYNAFVIVSGIK